MATKVSAEELLERGAHFGHQSKRWNPKMEEYLYGEEGGVSVFDLIKTKKLLEEALEFLKSSAKEGKVVLFVGCKKQAQEKTREIAEATGSSYFTERWLGGTLTNFDQIKKSIKKLADMKEKMANGEYASNTKEETAIREASSKGVRVVGIVDSNADPERIDYPIPMNDDAVKAVDYVLDLMKEAIN